MERRLCLGRPLRFNCRGTGGVHLSAAVVATPARVWKGGLDCRRRLMAISTAVQIASLAFWLPLEIYQMETLGHPTFVVALRFKNIVAFALGKMDAWCLNNHAMTEDSWDYVHITTWNFLPFLLKRVGETPAWVVMTAFSVWCAALAALAWIFVRLNKVLALGEDVSVT